MTRFLESDFFAVASRTPHNVAVFDEAIGEISYGSLASYAEDVALLLSTFNLDRGREGYITILSSVCTESIAGLLGTLRAGFAYVPLDEKSPARRNLSILRGTKCQLLLLHEDYDHLLPSLLSEQGDLRIVVKMLRGRDPSDWEVFTIKDWSGTPRRSARVTDDLAYILHTSGSTGVPKGIMLTHHNALAFTDWMQHEFKLTMEDRVMSRAPLKFDLSVFDIFNPLSVGASIICYDWHKQREQGQEHKAYVKLLEESKATILYTTPSTIMSLIDRGELGVRNHTLRRIMYAGEPFPTARLCRAKERLPDTAISNIYGPTETNIITYYHLPSKISEGDEIPLGVEVHDTEIVVVDPSTHTECPPGVEGELWCRGATVCKGYFCQEELTRSHLVQSPFHRYPTYYWRTGDYGRRDKEGILYYHGRKDALLKIKGYRIDLGDVEGAVARHPRLQEGTAVPILNQSGEKTLALAYSTLDGRAIQEAELTEFLTTLLPPYMIPTLFIHYSELPKTSTGKVDRVHLLETLEKSR